MPSLSGPELVAQLPHKLQGRVIWVTGGTGDDETVQRLAGRPILHKPFSTEALLAMLDGLDFPARNQAG